MKRILCILLVALLALSGCRSSAGEVEPAVTQETQATESSEAVEFTQESEPDTGVAGENLPEDGGDTLTLGDGGCLRVPYTVNQSSVRYITSASQLPDYEELRGYDDAYFETKALLLVLESVGSGSVEVSIADVTVEGSRAVVTLSHELQGDLGTADMATWLLWAEVEAGLDCQWSVANPALKPEAESY